MIPKTMYTRLAQVELTMVAAQRPAVVWLACSNVWSVVPPQEGETR